MWRLAENSHSGVCVQTSNEKDKKMRLKRPLLLLALLAIAETLPGHALAADDNGGTQTMSRAGSQASIKGPAKFFTGDARIDPLFPANKTAHYSGAYVTFEPGARSAWHLHPAGQHIIVTSGVGRTGVWGGSVQEIKAGDVIWCPPGVKHWHGASPTTAMTHIVITGSLDGKNVVWGEKVTDAQYNAN
jgi:quercetin dioxygenase-like cupin family protein